MSIGAKIKAARESANMTQEELGLRCGTTKQTIFKYETGVVTNIPLNRLEQIAEAIGVSPAYLMGWEETVPAGTSTMPGVNMIPRIGTIACGEPILAEQNFNGYDAVPDFVNCDFTLVCKGDSMIGARICDGDIVCIKQQPEVENGQIAAVQIGEDSATLKRIRYLPGGVALWPENPAYAPMIFTGEDVSKIRILGLATHFISRVI